MRRALSLCGAGAAWGAAYGTMLLAVAAQAQQARLTEKKRWRDNARIDDMMPDGAHEATGEVARLKDHKGDVEFYW